MVIDGNRLILIIGKKILFKKNSKSELSPKKIRPDRTHGLVHGISIDSIGYGEYTIYGIRYGPDPLMCHGGSSGSIDIIAIRTNAYNIYGGSDIDTFPAQFSIVDYFVQLAQFTHTVICINKTN